MVKCCFHAELGVLLTVPGGLVQTPLTVSCLPGCGTCLLPCLQRGSSEPGKGFCGKLSGGVGGKQGSELWANPRGTQLASQGTIIPASA